MTTSTSETVLREALEPCPFCGEQPTTYQGRMIASVKCDNGHAVHIYAQPLERAVTEWNTRHRISALDQPSETVRLREELTRGKDELLRLMDSIWRAEFMKVAPDWKPLDDLPGMISQIDNMYAGVRQQRDRARWHLAALTEQQPTTSDEREQRAYRLGFLRASFPKGWDEDEDFTHGDLRFDDQMQDDLESEYPTPLAASPPASSPEGEDLHDVVTHRASWRNAIILARDEASEGSEDPDADRSYWNHELRAFDRTFDKLTRLIASAPALPSRGEGG